MRLIDADKAIMAIEQHRIAVLEGHKWDEGIEYGYAAAHRHLVDIIEQLPSAQPERKTGRWILVASGRGGYECSCCHEYAPSYRCGEDRLSNFCPNCGADMRGDKHEID